MNYRKTVRSAGMAICICSAALADNAISQTAGSFTLATGWLHIAPQGSAT
ncbi:OmpW family protein, partial [Burkholderia sp. SIMBA_052]